jgi:hypothetical protein
MQAAVAIAAAPRAAAPEPFGPVCFELGRRLARAPRPVPPLRLADDCADALAELLPLLLCGEESAALAFGRGGANAALATAARDELERIRREEVVHGLLLQRLQTALPKAALEEPLLARMRRFFITLADPDPGRYFARIAGLDSAVCMLLGALRRKRSPLSADRTLAATFARIHRDEAGHVDAARRFALAYAPATLAIGIATETRRRLVKLLRERGAAFERLGVDADDLFARLGTVSRGIFR